MLPCSCDSCVVAADCHRCRAFADLRVMALGSQHDVSQVELQGKPAGSCPRGYRGFEVKRSRPRQRTVDQFQVSRRKPVWQHACDRTGDRAYIVLAHPRLPHVGMFWKNSYSTTRHSVGASVCSSWCAAQGGGSLFGGSSSSGVPPSHHDPSENCRTRWILKGC